jgi:GAF domain-containing protein
MTYDLFPHTPLTPADAQAPERMRRLRALGIGEQPDDEFDDFARRLTEATHAPYALVNFIGEDHQYLGGLHTAPHAPVGNEVVAMVQAHRIMPSDYGFCPHVVTRRKALVLDDVCEYPRFAGNPVVDEIGIRSYLGAPLIDRTGMALGTICVVDLEPRPWGRPGLELIKSFAADLVARINKRDTTA